MGTPAEIPFSYGDVISITGIGTKVLMWLRDPNGVIRGVSIDISDPVNPAVSRAEIIIKRRTEGHAPRRKGGAKPV